MRSLAAIENVFFLILVGLVGLARWGFALAESKRNEAAARRARAETPTPNAPVERAPTQTEEERVRRFMEALGVPTTSAPPPKAQPRRVVPKTPARSAKRKIAPVDPFPKPRATTWAPEPVVVVQPPVVATPPPLPDSTSNIAPIAVAPTIDQRLADYDVQDVSRSAQSGSLVRQEILTAPVGWAARLASADGARDAIILREIFGPPRSLQALHELRAI